MKRSLIILGISCVFLACNSRNTTTSTDDTTSIENQSTVTEPSTMDTVATAPDTPPADAAASSPQAPAASAPSASKPAAAKASTAKGEQLISKSDCLACHKVSEKLVGPAYTAVATKYDDTEANISYLAGKIISGGSGVWGDIPMTPHPAISNDDAREMAKYILSLK